ncbi:MAG: KH domain-containing protein [Gaiella sp.]
MADALEELIVWVARGLVDDPDAVRLERIEEDGVTVLRLTVGPGDVGRVIGRQGRLARSLRTLVRAGGGHMGERLQLEIGE